MSACPYNYHGTFLRNQQFSINCTAQSLVSICRISIVEGFRKRNVSSFNQSLHQFAVAFENIHVSPTRALLDSNVSAKAHLVCKAIYMFETAT